VKLKILKAPILIAANIEVHQLPALSQHSCKPLCSVCSKIKIVTETTALQLECDDVPAGCHRRELPQNELALCLFRAIAGVVLEDPAQADNGR
jgi:hypothetical protein